MNRAAKWLQFLAFSLDFIWTPSFRCLRGHQPCFIVTVCFYICLIISFTNPPYTYQQHFRLRPTVDPTLEGLTHS